MNEPTRANLDGVNEYGVPLHACHGHRHDEHYWCWVREKNRRDKVSYNATFESEVLRWKLRKSAQTASIT